MKKNILKWFTLLFSTGLLIAIIAFFINQQEKKEELAEIAAEEQERVNELLVTIRSDFENSKEKYSTGNLSEAISEIHEGVNYANYLKNDKKMESELLTEVLNYYNQIVKEYFITGEGNVIYHKSVNDLTEEQVESFYTAYILIDEDALDKDLATTVIELEEFYNKIVNKREQIWDNKRNATNQPSKSQSPYTKEMLENDPTAPSTNPNDYNSNGEYVPENGVSDNPSDYSLNGEYKPVEEMTDEEIIEELQKFFNGE